MKNIAVPVEFDARVAENIKDDDIPLERRMRVWAAISLYLDFKISIGKAAELAGMDDAIFQDYPGKHRIPISLLTYEEFQRGVEMLRKNSQFE